MHTKEDKLKAFERLLDVQERLRHDCPWDKAQTFESLRPNTIEETFELCDDVMEHVILYSVIGSETGDFDIADVCNHQADKLMFRHDFIDWRGWTVSNEDMEIDADGHVNYKKTCSSTDSSTSNTPKTSSQVESSWEQRKQMERDGNKTVLSGVPDALPSIIKAYRIQDKARNVGFDWKKPADVQAQEILDNATIEANELKSQAMQYMDDMLAHLENIISASTQQASSNYDTLIGNLNQYRDIIQSNRSELHPVDEDLEGIDNADEGSDDLNVM